MISPNLGEGAAQELADAYAKAELEILRKITAATLKGIESPDWQLTQLANMQALRADTLKTLAALNATRAAQLAKSIEDAYRVGENSALGDLGRYQTATNAVSSAARRAAVRQVATELSEKVASASQGVLRAVPDIYRRVVGEAVNQSLLGAVSRKAAAKSALETLLGQGILLSPESGRGRMNLTDYVTMAVRTGTAQAAIAGHVATLAANDLDLVMITPGPRACDICDPWGNLVLSGSGEAGTYEVMNLVTGEPMEVEVHGSLQDAELDGWGHPNCRCGLKAYIPGATEVGPRLPFDREGYEAQQRQREIERHIRQWKTKEALAIDPASAAKANAKVSDWQAAQRQHIANNPFLKRQSSREQVGNVNPLFDVTPTSQIPPILGNKWVPSTDKDGYLQNLSNLDVTIDPANMPKLLAHTKAQQESMNHYVGGSYADLNERLRLGVTPPNPRWQKVDIDETIENVKDVTMSGTFTEDARVIRSARWDALGDIHGKKLGVDGYFTPWNGLTGQDAIDYAEGYIGKTVKDEGFISTSIPLKAPKSTYVKAPYSDNDVVYNVLIPKGSKGGVLGDLNARASEREVLLPPGTEFQIVDALIDPDTGQLRLTVIAKTP